MYAIIFFQNIFRCTCSMEICWKFSVVVFRGHSNSVGMNLGRGPHSFGTHTQFCILLSSFAFYIYIFDAIVCTVREFASQNILHTLDTSMCIYSRYITVLIFDTSTYTLDLSLYFVIYYPLPRNPCLRAWLRRSCPSVWGHCSLPATLSARARRYSYVGVLKWDGLV